MYVYINKETKSIIMLSRSQRTFEESSVSEYNTPFEMPTPKAGFTIELSWDDENKKVVVLETPVEIETEKPTMEEQILFETKYQTLLLETMTLGGN